LREIARERPSGGVHGKKAGGGGALPHQKKVEAVHRLLRGEDLDAGSDDLGVTAATLSKGA
jgi:hypothetical protein